MGRRATNPAYVCPRCRYETRSSRVYRKHMFERKTPCVPHPDGYMSHNYQPVLFIKKMWHALQNYPEEDRRRKAADKFFAKLSLDHWCLKMIPDDEHENVKKMLE